MSTHPTPIADHARRQLQAGQPTFSRSFVAAVLIESGLEPDDAEAVIADVLGELRHPPTQTSHDAMVDTLRQFRL